MSTTRGQIHLAATVGDPLSIGPEVACKGLIQFLDEHPAAVVHLHAPRWALKKFYSARLRRFEKSHRLIIREPVGPRCQKPGAESGKIALVSLENAALSTLSNHTQALITGPVDKSLVSLTRPFSGHTEHLQKMTGSQGSTMLLTGPELTVGLVTTHLPLSGVSAALSISRIVATTSRMVEHLKIKLGRKPRIGVCALNPHAGDHGLFGDEEIEIIQPAIKLLQKSFGTKITGPYPADTIFHRSQDFDAITCMYHDQGLIPLKMTHFYDAVNVTLGLPFLRTSVDHGTAFDIAGKNKASYQSYLRALEYAYDWVRASNSN